MMWIKYNFGADFLITYLALHFAHNMKKHFVRTKKIKKLFFLKGKKIFVNDFKTFLKKYKVHDLIKLLKNDFCCYDMIFHACFI